MSYPAPDQPFSFAKLREKVAEVGCVLKLRGGRGNKKDQRSVLIVKGPEAPAVYEMVFTESLKAGLDLSSVPLKPVIVLEDPENDDENASGEALKEAFISVDWSKDTNDEDMEGPPANITPGEWRGRENEDTDSDVPEVLEETGLEKGLETGLETRWDRFGNMFGKIDK